MEEKKIIVGRTTDEIWQQVEADLSGEELYDYQAVLDQNGRQVDLFIEIDLGGGFESGYQITTFTAQVAPEHDFRFALHHQDLIDTAGKFFGMEDVEIGYPEFDDALIVKTNDPLRTRQVFFDESLRKVFQQLQSFSLHIAHHHVDGQEGKRPFLELSIEEGITDPDRLRVLYQAFFQVLVSIDGA